MDRLNLIRNGGKVKNWENVKYDVFQKLNTGNNFFVQGVKAEQLQTEDPAKNEYSSVDE